RAEAAKGANESDGERGGAAEAGAERDSRPELDLQGLANLQGLEERPDERRRGIREELRRRLRALLEAAVPQDDAKSAASTLDPALRVPVDREVDGHRPRMEDVQRPEIERPAREVDSRRSARFDCQLGPHARRILLNSRGAKDGAGGAYRASSADAADEGG